MENFQQFFQNMINDVSKTTPVQPTPENLTRLLHETVNVSADPQEDEVAATSSTYQIISKPKSKRRSYSHVHRIYKINHIGNHLQCQVCKRLILESDFGVHLQNHADKMEGNEYFVVRPLKGEHPKLPSVRSDEEKPALLHECEICNEQFKSNHMKENHIRMVHNEGALRCIKCATVFKTWRNYYYHTKTKRCLYKDDTEATAEEIAIDREKFGFACHDCNIYFKNMDFLASHNEKYHPPIELEECILVIKPDDATGEKVKNDETIKPLAREPDPLKPIRTANVQTQNLRKRKVDNESDESPPLSDCDTDDSIDYSDPINKPALDLLKSYDKIGKKLPYMPAKSSRKLPTKSSSDAIQSSTKSVITPAKAKLPIWKPVNTALVPATKSPNVVLPQPVRKLPYKPRYDQPSRKVSKHPANN